MRMTNKFAKLVLCILLCEGAGIIGSIFTLNSVATWYVVLQKPFFNPPSWIFGPVWTTLYFLMGISLFLVWGKKKTNFKWFWAQLALNVLWSIVFFGMKSPLLAFFVIILLWLSIFNTIQSFKPIDKRSAYLLYPYLGWVSFALLLNLSITILNR